MPTYGYARVSTIDQDLSLQRRTLKAAGCEVIRAERRAACAAAAAPFGGPVSETPDG